MQEHSQKNPRRPSQCEHAEAGAIVESYMRAATLAGVSPSALSDVLIGAAYRLQVEVDGPTVPQHYALGVFTGRAAMIAGNINVLEAGGKQA